MESACSDPVRPTSIFEPGAKESFLADIEVKELNRVTRGTCELAHISKQMDKGIETLSQPSRKLLRRAEEALINLRVMVYRQIPLELVNEHELAAC